MIDAAMHGFGRAVVPRHRLGGAAEEALHVVADTKAMRAPVVLHHFRQPAYTRAHEAVRDAIVTGVPHLLQPTGRRRSSRVRYSRGMVERLLSVEDAFVAKGPGVLVMPRFTTATPPRGTFAVQLRFTDGSTRDATAEVEVAHMRGPLPPFAMYRLHGLVPEDVPAGTEIWSVAP